MQFFQQLIHTYHRLVYQSWIMRTHSRVILALSHYRRWKCIELNSCLILIIFDTKIPHII